MLLDSKSLSGEHQGHYKWPFAIVLCCLKGHEAMVKLLATRTNVEVDIKDKYGHLTLSYATANRPKVVVKLLVARDDVELDSRNKDGCSLLSYATVSPNMGMRPC